MFQWILIKCFYSVCLSQLVNETDASPELDHLSLYHNLNSIEYFNFFSVNNSCFLLRHAFYTTTFNHEQSFNTVLLHHHVDATLRDPHYNSCLQTVSLALRQTFEVQISVEPDTGLWAQCRHTVLAVHLVALFSHLELINHIIRQRLNVETGCQ